MRFVACVLTDETVSGVPENSVDSPFDSRENRCLKQT